VYQFPYQKRQQKNRHHVAPGFPVSTPEMMGGIHDGIERSRHRVTVDLPNGCDRYAAILRDGFDIDTIGQIPAYGRMPQSVPDDLHLAIIRSKPGFLYNRIPALPEAADGPFAC
jgi:hypothetical protein